LLVIEMITERVWAAYQQVKVRDLHDLHCFATRPFDRELLRHLAVWMERAAR
jgi:hypothetical protein